MPKFQPSSKGRVTKNHRRDGPRKESSIKNDAKAGHASFRDKRSPMTDSLGRGFSRGTFESHAAMLNDSRMSHSMYAGRREQFLRQIQADYGNQYAQRLIKHGKMEMNSDAQIEQLEGSSGSNGFASRLGQDKDALPQSNRIDPIPVSSPIAQRDLLKGIPPGDIKDVDCTGALIESGNDWQNLIKTYSDSPEIQKRLMKWRKEKLDLIAELLKLTYKNLTYEVEKGSFDNESPIAISIRSGDGRDDEALADFASISAKTLGNQIEYALDVQLGRPTALQRVEIDEPLKEVLQANELRFFEEGPGKAEAEAMLVEMMTREESPIMFELGLVYDGETLQAVKMGHAASEGGNAQVKIDPTDLNPEGQRQNQVVTHNHPGGAPLSQGDVLFAVQENIKEIRAAGEHGTFAFSREGDTWGEVNKGGVAKAFIFDAKAEWQKNCPTELKGLLPKDTKMPQIGNTFAEDFFMQKHFACKALANEYKGVVNYDCPSDKTLVEVRSQLYEKRKETALDQYAGTQFRTRGTRSKGGSFEV